MRMEAIFATGAEERPLAVMPQPLAMTDLIAGDGEWEVELGFGKGRYLLQRAQAVPERRFLGIEVVSRYYRLLHRRARSHGVENLCLIRGEALYLLSAVLPRAWASVLHVYFPDPWPKSRHHKRRLFDPETVDLVLGVLRPGGHLCFATDFLDYGERVWEILTAIPELRLERLNAPWPDGARTNYEAKYMAEGRPILRFLAHLAEDTEAGLHPAGRAGILAATAVREEPE